MPDPGPAGGELQKIPVYASKTYGGPTVDLVRVMNDNTRAVNGDSVRSAYPLREYDDYRHAGHNPRASTLYSNRRNPSGSSSLARVLFSCSS